MSESMTVNTAASETLEIKRLRLPEYVNTRNMPQIMADLEHLFEPGVGIVLDFNRTQSIEPDCLKAFEFANNLAQEQSVTLSYMGIKANVWEIFARSTWFQPHPLAD